MGGFVTGYMWCRVPAGGEGRRGRGALHGARRGGEQWQRRRVRGHGGGAECGALLALRGVPAAVPHPVSHRVRPRGRARRRAQQAAPRRRAFREEAAESPPVRQGGRGLPHRGPAAGASGRGRARGELASAVARCVPFSVPSRSLDLTRVSPPPRVQVATWRNVWGGCR